MNWFRLKDGRYTYIYPTEGDAESRCGWWLTSREDRISFSYGGYFSGTDRTESLV